MIKPNAVPGDIDLLKGLKFHVPFKKFPVFELTGNYMQEIEIAELFVHEKGNKMKYQGISKFPVIFPVLKESDRARRRDGAALCASTSPGVIKVPVNPRQLPHAADSPSGS
jgi:hypothetical protein